MKRRMKRRASVGGAKGAGFLPSALLSGGALLGWLATTEARADDVKVACVGDSITFGYQASSTSKSYPSVLSSVLGAGWNVRNFGNNGKTMMKAPADGASYWDQPEFTQSKAFLPDVVVLMLGTNDSKTTNWKSGNNTYAADYAAMVGVYAALTSKPKIWAMLPPPALSTTFAISPAVIDNEILPIIKKVAADTGIGVIDLNAAFRAHDAASLIQSDGIHPNDNGYAFIAETVAAVLRASPADGGSPDGGPADAAGSDGARDALSDTGVADAAGGDSGTGGSSSPGGGSGGGGAKGGGAKGGGGANSAGGASLGGSTGGGNTGGSTGGSNTGGSATGGSGTGGAGNVASTPSDGCSCASSGEAGRSGRGMVATSLALALGVLLGRSRRRERHRD